MAANRKSEVTKLLTVTLDKIHESKRAKSGPNLRKSLLVASVLHKARDVYVTEIKNVRVDKTAPSVTVSSNISDDSNSCDSTTTTTTTCMQESQPISLPVKRKFSSQSSIIEQDRESQIDCDTDTDSISSSDDSDCDDQDYVESSATKIKRRHFLDGAATRSDSMLANDFLDELATDSEMECNRLDAQTDKENSPPSIQAQTETSQSSTIIVLKSEPKSFSIPLSSSCGRCLKRRSSTQYDSHSETDLNSNSDSDSLNNQITTYNIVPKKRLRRISSVDNSEPETESSCLVTTRTPVMDSTQINSLVKIFSQSFDVSESTPTYENSTEFNTFALCGDSITLTA